jgi:hypothetical protein
VALRFVASCVASHCGFWLVILRVIFVDLSLAPRGCDSFRKRNVQKIQFALFHLGPIGWWGGRPGASVVTNDERFTHSQGATTWAPAPPTDWTQMKKRELDFLDVSFPKTVAPSGCQ